MALQRGSGNNERMYNLKKFKKVIFSFDNFLGYCACALIFIGMMLVVISVFLRFTKLGSIPGMTDYLGFLTAITVAFSIPLVEKNRGHIRVELLDAYLPKKVSKTILAVLDLICNLVIALICWRFLLYSADVFKTGMKTWVAFLPYWPSTFVCSIGLLAFFFTAVINYVEMLMKTDEKSVAEKEGVV